MPNPISRNWSIIGRGRPQEGLGPAPGALRHEGRCKLNVIFLLPQFLRDHLYNHPFLSEGPNRAKQDSFWSAMNTFNEPPDDRFSDMPYVHQVLDRDYYKIQEPSRLGDLVFLATADQVALHAAVFIADDVVFTKNGDSDAQPWILYALGRHDRHACRASSVAGAAERAVLPQEGIVTGFPPHAPLAPCGRGVGPDYSSPDRNPKRKRGPHSELASLTLRVTIAHTAPDYQGDA